MYISFDLECYIWFNNIQEKKKPIICFSRRTYFFLPFWTWIGWLVVFFFAILVASRNFFLLHHDAWNNWSDCKCLDHWNGHYESISSMCHIFCVGSVVSLMFSLLIIALFIYVSNSNYRSIFGILTPVEYFEPKKKIIFLSCIHIFESNLALILLLNSNIIYWIIYFTVY